MARGPNIYIAALLVGLTLAAGNFPCEKSAYAFGLTSQKVETCIGDNLKSDGQSSTLGRILQSLKFGAKKSPNIFPKTSFFIDEETRLKDIGLPHEVSDSQKIELLNLASEYQKDGRWQEAIWTLKRAGETREAEGLQLKLDSLLGRGKIVRIAEFKNGRNEDGSDKNLFLIEYEGGVFGIFKPKTSDPASCPSCEQAARVVSDIYNLDNVTTSQRAVINGLEGSVSIFIKDANYHVGDFDYNRSKKLNLLHVLTAQYDTMPHNPNFLQRPGGFEVSYDQGGSFGGNMEDDTHSMAYYLTSFRQILRGDDHFPPTQQEIWSRLPDATEIAALKSVPDQVLKSRLVPYLPPEKIQAVIDRKNSVLKEYQAWHESQLPPPVAH